jgi:hypothetical protein
MSNLAGANRDGSHSLDSIEGIGDGKTEGSCLEKLPT